MKFSHGRSWFRHDEDLKDTQDLRKAKGFFDTFVRFLVIGVDVRRLVKAILKPSSYGVPL